MREKIGLQLKAQKRKAVFSEFFKLADLHFFPQLAQNDPG